ncbi:MAG: thiamine diphosphokinase [Pseudomonadota bacterium]
MPDPLFHTDRPTTLIGGSETARFVLETALSHAPVLVAADGGADKALTLNHRPVAIMGDMDSLTNRQTWRNSDIKMYPIGDQDTTDFEKCLEYVQAPLLLACGFTGGRVDHTLAVMAALYRYRARPVIVLSRTDLVLHWPDDLVLDLPTGTRVSFHPVVPVAGLGSTGLAWDLAGLHLAPGGLLGTSNRATGGPVSARFEAPGALGILPLEHLPQVVAALSIRAR